MTRECPFKAVLTPIRLGDVFLIRANNCCRPLNQDIDAKVLSLPYRMAGFTRFYLKNSFNYAAQLSGTAYPVILGRQNHLI